MVQKYQSPVRVYKYPFELVMAVSNAFAGNLVPDFSQTSFRFLKEKVFGCMFHAMFNFVFCIGVII